MDTKADISINTSNVKFQDYSTSNTEIETSKGETITEPKVHFDSKVQVDVLIGTNTTLNTEPKIRLQKTVSSTTAKPTWKYKLDGLWIDTKNSEEIEEEFQKHLNGTRVGQRCYHCFGDRCTALIDFHTFKTYCGSGKCAIRNHGRNGLTQDHMTYDISRFD